MSRKNKIITVMASLFAVYTITGFIIIPGIAKIILPEKLKKVLKREVTIENISLNPFAASLKVQGFKILTKDKKEDFFSLKEIYLNIDCISSLFSISPVIEKIYLSHPHSYMERIDKKKFSFSDLIKKDKSEKKESPKKNKKTLGFLIREITIDNGNFSFNDKYMGKKHEIKDLNIQSDIISNFKKYRDIPVTIDISSMINRAGLNIDIKSKPFSDSLDTYLALNIKNIKIKDYFNYFKEFINFIPETGKIDLATKIHFKNVKDPEEKLMVNGKLDIKNLKIRSEDKKDLASFKNFSVEMDKTHPIAGEIKIKKILLDSPVIDAERKNGGINLLRLVKNKDGNKESKNGSQDKKKDFKLYIDSIEIADAKAAFTDYDAPLFKSGLHNEPVKNTISGFNLRVSSFSTAKGSNAKAKINAVINRNATISMDGDFSINPIFANINTSLENLDLSSSNGYIPKDVKILVQNGDLTIKAKSRIEKMENKFNFSTSSDISIKDINILERDSKNKLFKMNDFRIKGLNFNLNPKSLGIEEIYLSGIDQNILMDKNGQLNLKRVLPKKEKSEKKKTHLKKNTNIEKKETGENFPINISLVKMDDIKLSYKDKSLSPYFSTKIEMDSGRIKGLSTKAFNGADINISAKIDNSAPVSIKGKINPLLKDLLVDLKIDMKNINLTSFTPYSGKYIGRAIEKGHLSLNLDYDIKRKKLKAENKVLMDQFTLGRDIKSKDASNLPVGLAIALLKDRNGEINLDIPVSGSLDDPKFKVGQVIIQVLKNLVVKAATSPFALVTSLTGGGEDIKFIEFKYGSNEFDEKSLKKLNSIEKLLFERPELKLDIKGYVDPLNDIKAMRDAEFEKLINNKKASLGINQNKEVDEKEYLKVLKEIYKERFKSEPFPEQVSETTGQKKISMGLIKEKIKSSILFSDDDLRFLSSSRAKKIKEYILKNKRINPSRLFINDSEKIIPEKNYKASSARGELGLK